MFVKKSLHEFESRVLTHLTRVYSKRGGKDIFVTVSGDYVKSSFGSSLDALCRLTVPIRDLCDGSIIKLEKGQPASEIPEIKVCARLISTNLSKHVFPAFGQTEIWAFLVFGLFHLSLPRKVHQSP